VTPANIAINDISLKTRFCDLHFRCRKYWCIFNHFYAIRPESYRIRWNYAPDRAITPFKVIQSHRVWYQSKAHMWLPISELYKLSSYLAPFPRYRPSVRYVKNRYIWLPLLCLTPPTEGFPWDWDDLDKIFIQRSWMAKVPHGVEILPKISIAWVGCTNVTDDRRQTTDKQTVGPSMTYSERSLKIKRSKIKVTACAKIRKIINNSAGDCLISLKFRTDFDHMTLDVPRTFQG